MAGSNQTMASQITGLAAPHEQSTTQPPFSRGELILMVLCIEGQPLTLKEIIVRIIKRFDYYASSIVDAASDHGYNPGRTFDGPFEKALTEFDLPITIIPQPNNAQDKYATTESEVRIALSKYLKVPSPSDSDTAPTPFRFLKLPAELRNYIYEMIFTFPASGIRPRKIDYRRGSRHNMEFEMLSHDPNHQGTMNDWMGLQWNGHALPAPIHSRPTEAVLELLCVSKQVKAEALPIFYGKNRFIGRSIAELKQLTTNCKEEALDCISNIGFNYDARDRLRADTIFKKMLNLKSLKKVTMRFDETQWTTYMHYGALTYTDASRYNGIKTLRRGCEEKLDVLSLEGSCDALALWLAQNIRDHKVGFQLMLNGREVRLGQGDVLRFR